ncbi:MAG: hypothetical protein L6R41_005303 [Letrouitia leprolyta]|nr:MAG: hypothetical protein L6R41_005303 [Letrouitia leprolyta]
MPKAAKSKSTSARSTPLRPKNGNATKSARPSVKSEHHVNAIENVKQEGSRAIGSPSPTIRKKEEYGTQEEAMKEKLLGEETVKSELVKKEEREGLVKQEYKIEKPMKQEPTKDEEPIENAGHDCKADSTDEAIPVLEEKLLKTEQPTIKTETRGGGEATSDKDDSNYLVVIALISSKDPTITRFLSVPPTLTFADFHQVLQIAFGWSGMHEHNFIIDVATRLDAGSDWLLPKIVLQLNSHPDGLGLDSKPQRETEWRLRDVFEKKVWDDEDGNPVGTGPGEGRVTLRYGYDMGGDGWMHIINLLGRSQKNLHGDFGCKDMPVLCLGGEGHPCAEDSGGSVGWERLKRIHQKKRCNREDKDYKDWYKNDCLNGDPEGLDPYQWDLLDVNAELTDMFGSPE